MPNELSGVGSHQVNLDVESLHLDNDLRQPYHVPIKYLEGTRDDLPGASHSAARQIKELPPHPTLVFINPKSGGQMGTALLKLFGEVVGVVQVYQLPKQRPDKVLKKIWQNLDAAVREGDEKAWHIQNNLRVVAAGGDGTYSWLLQAISEIGIQPQPPASVIPLGTGNGMSVNLGWGHKASSQWVKSRKSMADMIKGVSTATIRDMDLWSISLTSGLPDQHQQNALQNPHPSQQNGKDDGSKRRRDIPLRDQAPFIDSELPAAIHAQHDGTMQGSHRAGKFTYYFTVGLDAEAAYRFNDVRNQKPYLAKYRWQNIGWYFYEAVATGWLWGAKPLSRKIASVRVRRSQEEDWQELVIPKAVRAIVMINLQTYMGGQDLWGLHEHNTPEEHDKKLVKPIFDDGLLEIVGLKGGLHTSVALSNVSPHIHGVRLGQTSEVEVQFEMQTAGKKGLTHMRLDGEPWAQPFPAKGAAEGPLRVHVKLAGRSRVLINTHNLPGVNAKALQLSNREQQESKPERGESASSSSSDAERAAAAVMAGHHQ
ncbi:hypothetical protein ABBQ32_000102 [Trebouxia sp. C0010 RCD-2024]